MNQIVENNQHNILKQKYRQTEIEPKSGNFRKVECTHCKNYMQIKIMLKLSKFV